MKQIFYVSLIFILVPFLVVTFLLIDRQKKITIIDENLKSDLLVRVKREKKNKIELIPIEEYIVGVVAGEMPVTFHLEALKAQAVAARSYVLKRIEYNKGQSYDVVDNVLSQVYLDNQYLKTSWANDYQTNILKIKTAVLMTKGEYIEYDGKIADALYFSTSNGFTENSDEVFGFEAPYLKSVASIWDQETSPVFNDDKHYPLASFYQLLDIPYQSELKIKIIKKSSTGRIIDLIINEQSMKGSDLVKKLNLRSNDFNIKQQANNVIIETKGFGHGVGMSQYGALGMAEDGYLYDEILAHYYQGTKIGKL